MDLIRKPGKLRADLREVIPWGKKSWFEVVNNGILCKNIWRSIMQLVTLHKINICAVCSEELSTFTDMNAISTDIGLFNCSTNYRSVYCRRI